MREDWLEKKRTWDALCCNLKWIAMVESEQMEIRLWVFLRDWGLSELKLSGEEKQKDISSLAVEWNGNSWNCSCQLLKLTMGEPIVYFV